MHILHEQSCLVGDLNWPRCTLNSPILSQSFLDLSQGQNQTKNGPKNGAKGVVKNEHHSFMRGTFFIFAITFLRFLSHVVPRK